MISVLKYPLAVAVVVVVSVDAQGAAPSSSSPPSYRDRYEFMESHNMFVRDRSRRSYRREEPTTRESARPAVESSFVLTGIVEEDGEVRAYVEDTSVGRLLRLGQGDTVAGGKVVKIELDGVIYEGGGEQVWIAVGKTLSGGNFTPTSTLLMLPGTVTATGPGTGVPGSTTQPTTQPSIAVNPDDPSLSIEQRMKLRRMMEQKR